MKKKKKPSIVTVDALWAKFIKLRAGNKCEVCKRTDGLNSHHIFSRSNRATRWDINNGISVCVSHHLFGNFSAHKSPVEFTEWLKENRGEKWYQDLRIRAKSVYEKQDTQLIKDGLVVLIEGLT